MVWPAFAITGRTQNRRMGMFDFRQETGAGPLVMTTLDRFGQVSARG